SLVGYTNAGKSSLMKLISKEEVYAKDELFATVDSTVRKVVINQIPFLLSDTVGFIRKLPHNLIESFKSTLEEVREADILLHVIDASNPSYDDHVTVVENTLAEIGIGDIKTIKIYNKVDKIEDLTEFHPEGVNNQEEIIFVSAKTKYHLQELRDLLESQVKKEHLKIYPNYLLPENY
ncbi:MAG: GTPase, partial [Marinoscillum sp.]